VHKLQGVCFSLPLFQGRFAINEYRYVESSTSRPYFCIRSCPRARIFFTGHLRQHTESAAIRKVDKYSALERTHFFQPIAVEFLGAMNTSAYLFLNELGQKISAVSGEERESSYLFQRISVLVQRYNAVVLHESFSDDNRPDQWPLEY